MTSVLAAAAVAAPTAPAAPPAVTGPAVAKVRAGESVPLHSAPGGRVVGRAGDRTRFGSRTALAVLRRRGSWLAVAPERRNRPAWIRADRRVELTRMERSVVIDLSERRLELREGRRVLRSVRVGVGRSSNPTPTGRFGVTDRLDGRVFGPYYGCCVIALSARQTELPDGWRGGDRIAIHGTTAPSTIGAPTSAGCLRADEADLRRLMVELPLGAPVTIRR